MSTEEHAWPIQEPGANQRVSAESVDSAGVGTGVAVPFPAAFNGDAQLPAAARRVREPDRIAWLVAAGLCLVAGVVEAAFLFAHTVGPLRLPLNNSVGIGVDEGSRVLALIICGVLLFFRRTREVASGLVLGIAAIWAARYFYTLRPARLSRGIDALGVSLFLAAFGLMVAGAIMVLTLVIRQRSRVTGSTRRQGRPDRVAAVVLGELGAMFWITGTLLTWEKIGVGTVSQGIERTESCCRWSQVDGWNQSSIVIGGVVFLILAVFAATIRAKALAAGLLFGIVVLPLADVLRVVITTVAPMPSFYGIRYSPEIMSFAKVTVSADVGLRIGLVGIALIAAAAVSRLLLGQRKDRYQVPELTGSAPIN